MRSCDCFVGTAEPSVDKWFRWFQQARGGRSSPVPERDACGGSGATAAAAIGGGGRVRSGPRCDASTAVKGVKEVTSTPIEGVNEAASTAAEGLAEVESTVAEGVD